MQPINFYHIPYFRPTPLQDQGAKENTKAPTQAPIPAYHYEPLPPSITRAYRETQCSQLMMRYRDRSYFHKNSWTPRWQLYIRMLSRFFSRACGVGSEVALGYAMGAATAYLMENMPYLSSNGRDDTSNGDAIAATVVNAFKLLADRNVRSTVSEIDIFPPSFATALLLYAVYRVEAGVEGVKEWRTHPAMLTQVGSALQVAGKDLLQVITTPTPTFVDDLWMVYKGILSVNGRQELIQKMPEDRKNSVRILQHEIEEAYEQESIKEARRRGRETDTTKIVSLLEALDMHIQMWECAVRPSTIFGCTTESIRLH